MKHDFGPRRFVGRMAIAVIGAAFFLSGCNTAEYSYPEPSSDKTKPPTYSNEKRETVFGEGGLDFGIFGDKKDNGAGGGGGGSGIAVNSYLWRASLDTIAFMPLSSADPFGGVIITDWYTPPEVPNERFKMNVYILGRQLRADGVKVAVFRQSQGENGQWRTADVRADTATSLENQILTRARQLRINGSN